MKPVMRTVLCVALGAASALAQSVVSAKSGTIHYVEGSAFLGDEAVQNKFGSFPEVKENKILRTEEGRVEVLLTPGVILRLAENSSMRMITTRLIDTRLELLTGSGVVEADEILKDNSVTVVHGDVAVHLDKKGLYRFDAQPAAVRVFDGEATVRLGDRAVEVKEGKMATLDGELAVAKFDKDETDTLDRWSRRRGQSLAMANLSAANSLRSNGSTWNTSGWFWNPYFGMFTFVPGSGVYSSPYGYRFYSPFTVYRIYQPRPVVAFGPGGGRGMAGGGGGGGYGTMARTGGGYSGVMASAPVSSAPVAHAPASTAAAAPSAPVSSAGGGGGGNARK
jgi:hypothetical protein